MNILDQCVQLEVFVLTKVSKTKREGSQIELTKNMRLIIISFLFLLVRELYSLSSVYKSLVDKVKLSVPKGSTVVIKYGGHAMDNEELKQLFFDDIAELHRSLGIVPVIVHGGGPQIAKTLKDLNVQSSFVNGLRVTDPKTMEVAQMVLCGSINKDLVASISRRTGVKGAIGLSGLDAGLIMARQKDPALGLVGEPFAVNTDLLRTIMNANLIPVIAPVGTAEDGSGSLNINADTAAGAVAQALKADYFLLLTDIAGVLDKEKKLITKIKSCDFASLKADGTISGGMIPKLETATQAVDNGVRIVSIADGRAEHCVLKALSGDIFGTVVAKE